MSADPVLIVTGPPGAGKTTTARLLVADAERAVHLESDLFFRFIRSGYIEPWKPESHEQNEVVIQIVAGAAIGYADAGYFTVVDGAVMPRWFLEPLSEALRAGGHQVAVAILRPSLETCISRATARGVDAGADRAVLERLWNEFADLGPLERHVLESEATAPEDVADAVAERLRAGILSA